MLIYNFDRITGVFTGSEMAQPDPLELKLARDAVHEPLIAAAETARAQKVALALQAYAEAISAQDLTTEDIEAAAAVRDFALSAAGQAHQAALSSAAMAAAAVQPVKWLEPVNSTRTPPPAFSFDEVAVWSDGAWSVRDADAIEDEDPGPDVAQLATDARAQRNLRIGKARWLIDRHRDEVAMGLTTTLTPEDYQLVLQHVQNLRDVPEQAEFPMAIAWPALPAEILASGA